MIYGLMGSQCHDAVWEYGDQVHRQKELGNRNDHHGGPDTAAGSM